jgi:hypothetical protein
MKKTQNRPALSIDLSFLIFEIFKGTFVTDQKVQTFQERQFSWIWKTLLEMSTDGSQARLSIAF